MNNNYNSSKSLITQIFEETLENLKKHQEFDGEIIEELARLAESGELKKHLLVSQSLKTTIPKDENIRS